MDAYRDVRFDGVRYPVIEMFTSVQFEGGRCGTLNHFLRLAGCNLKCAFCDTQMDQFEWMTPGEIRAKLDAMEDTMSTSRRLVITGGEPMVHDLTPLFTALGSGYYIAMESNGTRIQALLDKQPESLKRLSWLTISPKKPHSFTLLRIWASEVKYIIPDHESFIDLLHPRVFIQPEFNNPESVQRCVHLLSQYPQIRLSVQTHKYIGLR